MKARVAAQAAALFPPMLEGTYTHDDFNVQFLQQDGASSQGGFHGSAVSWFLLGATFDFSRF